MTDADGEHKQNWKSLPPLDGGVFVGMVTEILDDNEIPNLVSTDLSSGGVGMVIGTSTVGKPWRIKVPEEDYERALEIFAGIMGAGPEEPPADESASPEPRTPES
jgi:hypothetical protein